MRLIHFILVIVLFANSANAQFYGHPPFYFKTPIGYQKSNKVYEGVIFVEGKEIAGLVKFRRTQKVWIKTKADNNFVEVKNVTMVRLFQTDTNLLSQSYTEYRYLKIGKKYQWYRQIVNGKVSLFDQTTYCDEVPNYVNFSKMVIKQDTLYESINDFWSSSYKADLVKSLNRVFYTNYTNKDFKTKREVIDKFRLLASN
jgi:hypothetical protein